MKVETNDNRISIPPKSEMDKKHETMMKISLQSMKLLLMKFIDFLIHPKLNLSLCLSTLLNSGLKIIEDKGNFERILQLERRRRSSLTVTVIEISCLSLSGGSVKIDKKKVIQTHIVKIFLVSRLQFVSRCVNW
uniref:Uncharacterized protein n=1 Tax=Onchocerca volvulus TaxID=6282 RepID=A0A8R1XKD6_ONCVO